MLSERAVIALVVVAMLSVAGAGPASAQCGGLVLRSFTPDERDRFETQYGTEWWKVIGLIPGPAQPGDWVERPWGDSSRLVFIPQQFWDPRGCVAVTVDPRGGERPASRGPR